MIASVSMAARLSREGRSGWSARCTAQAISGRVTSWIDSVGALEHQPSPAQVHGEHAGRPCHRGGAALEDGRRLGDGHLATEREAERLERGRQVLRLGVGRALGHGCAAEDVEHQHVIHGRSP